ncbi:MAG: ribosomal protein S18-alanine N-acetyltransferase [Oscillospiraceae bacterium]
MMIRDVTEAEIPQIAAIERECFSLPWNEHMLEIQLGENYIFIAAMDGSTVLGYVGLMYVLDEGYISNVAVLASCRKSGIADALLAELRRRSEKLMLSFMTLEVRAGNRPAIALYRKHGFREAGRRKKYYETPREDAIIMTLELGN